MSKERKGAVLNQIMRKMLGEDEVVALKKELELLKEEIVFLQAQGRHMTAALEIYDSRLDKSLKDTTKLREDVDRLNSLTQPSELIIVKRKNKPRNPKNINVTIGKE